MTDRLQAREREGGREGGNYCILQSVSPIHSSTMEPPEIVCGLEVTCFWNSRFDIGINLKKDPGLHRLWCLVSRALFARDLN